MSWLSSLANGIGSIFGEDNLGGEVGDYISNLFSSSPELAPGNGSENPPGVGSIASKTANSHDTPGFYDSLIERATGLAGVYYTGQNSQEVADEQAKEAQNLAEFNYTHQATDAAQIAASTSTKNAKIAAGAQLAAARMNNLQQLYNTAASNRERSGEAQGDEALNTGKNMTAPIIARLSVLR